MAALLRKFESLIELVVPSSLMQEVTNRYTKLALEEEEEEEALVVDQEEELV